MNRSTKKTKALNRTIDISHPDKILFPQSKISKQEIVGYYTKIAPFFIPHVKDHLIVMQRFPDGIAKQGFYQKEISDYFPSWIKRKTIELKKGESQTLVIIDSADSLTYLANQLVLVFHSWLSPISHINKPNKIVFDFDPSVQDLPSLRTAVRHLKKIIEQHGLIPFLMTTGSRGYHIVIPIVPEHSFEQVHEFAKNIATHAAQQYPKLLTTQINIASRKDKIFIDYLRNSYGQTSVACYSVRAKEDAPIATPINWNELNRTAPQKYTIKNIFKRLSRKKDVWKDFEKSAKKIALIS